MFTFILSSDGLSDMLTLDEMEPCGFPLAQAVRHFLTLLRAGRAVTLIIETGRLLDGVKERVPRYRFERNQVADK